MSMKYDCQGYSSTSKTNSCLDKATNQVLDMYTSKAVKDTENDKEKDAEKYKGEKRGPPILKKLDLSGTDV